MLRVRCRRLEQPIVQIFLAEGSEQRARFGRNAIAITAREEYLDLRPRRDDTRVMQHGGHVGLGGELAANSWSAARSACRARTRPARDRTSTRTKSSHYCANRMQPSAGE